MTIMFWSDRLFLRHERGRPWRDCWTLPAAQADHVRPLSPVADEMNLVLGVLGATVEMGTISHHFRLSRGQLVRILTTD